MPRITAPRQIYKKLVFIGSFNVMHTRKLKYEQNTNVVHVFECTDTKHNRHYYQNYC